MRAGFIGLGNIGKPLAMHLAPAGFETTVFDLDEAPVRELVAGGAVAARSAREVAERADVIGICVPEDRHVRAVMNGPDGVLVGAKPGTVVLIHSTILPVTAIELDHEASPRGVRVLDACVTGGEHLAREAACTYMVGGDAALLEQARPFLEKSSKKIIHAGALGNGAKLKLCLNVMTYLQWAAAFEPFKLAQAIGLPTDVLEEAGRANGQLTDMMSRFLGGVKLPEEARRSDAYQKFVRGHLHTAEKDLAWALALAREAGVSLPAAALASQSMARIYGVEDPKRR
ncbi:MAG TPA: NAD(P)-dependent oxidoreductase [Myxococcota bacterium]|nr:NAD(P)-dependent oxidoreductase [Myxococcota bacterium]